MAEDTVNTGSRQLVTYANRDIWQTLLVGAIVGAAIWMLTWLFDRAIFEPLMCRVADADRCVDHFVYAAVAAQIFGAALGLVLLVRQLSYRPLLVVIAAAVTLWGVVQLASNWPWYVSLPVTAIVYALGYALFMLVARLRHLLLSIVVIVVLMVLVRLSMNS